MPNALQLGEKLPKTFREIHDRLGSMPRYKIVVVAIDTFSRGTRLVHCHYVSLLGEDPSYIRKLMAGMDNVKELPGIENGRSVDGLIAFKTTVKMASMLNVYAALARIVEDNSSSYTMMNYFNVVQHSGIGNDPITMGWNDVL